MALAPYFSRVHDAVASLADITGDELAALLQGTNIRVDLAPGTAQAEWGPGVDLLGNLLGRLYPVVTCTGPDRAVERLKRSARLSNPAVELPSARTRPTTRLRFGDHKPGADASVAASSWAVTVDEGSAHTRPQSLAGLASAAIAASEVFRHAFQTALGRHGRLGPQPGGFELVTGDPSRPAPDVDLSAVELPRAVLAGAGAVGQACALALAASRATGTLTVVDPEQVELTNLQRYVLTTTDDVGASKVDLVGAHLRRAGWTVDGASTRWGADARSGPLQDVVLVALDSARDRLGVAAGLHSRVYNAWTQPADLGWSRHEAFGTDPCLACLYYPTAPRPSDDELIAHAIGQPRLRVLSYLVTGVPIGLPLPYVTEVADLPVPADAPGWVRVPLLRALTDAGLVPETEQARWAGRSIGELYSAGICGGGLVTHDRSGLPAEVVVPLAHQSALAGVMLAVQFIAGHVPELQAARHVPIEGRLDLLAGFPQVSSRPRVRTQGCLCGDPAYRAAATCSRV